LNKNISLRQR